MQPEDGAYLSRTDRLMNTVYNFFSKDRKCSKCAYLKERLSITSRILATRAGVIPTHTIKECTLTKTIIDDKILDTKNCVHFKRKYGRAPLIQKMYKIGQRTKKEWQLHKTTIGVIATIIAAVLALIALLVAKGII